MAQLRIEFDQADRKFQPGEPVSGHVEITVDKEGKCDGLGVSLGWATSGHGNVEGGQVQTQELFSGALAAGSQRFPFALTAPPGPMSYRGQDLSVGWHVSALARLPRAVDPQVVERITLAGPGPIENYRAGAIGGGQQDLLDAMIPSPLLAAKQAFDGLNATVDRLKGTLDRTLGRGLILLLPLLVLGLIWLSGPVPALRGLVLVVILGIVAFVLFQFLGPQLAQRKLGRVSLDVAPREARPGQPLSCRLSFSPSASLTIESAEATLRCVERTTFTTRDTGRDGKTSSRSRTHEVFSGSLALSGAREATAGQTVVLSGRITLPATAAPSFHAHSNQLNWSIRVLLRVKNWPDWHDEVPLQVSP